ncbi:NADP-dependent isocitrate dehydrogenase [Babesia caballi]|uniref:NADP-dependent isocitrate dehydrogenase n=1 Tax=Babesia caballi TaxID=5871 RepID=A0AAV4LM06_BABCB|nr:NADP-dependent isocitrate dehydrogenase [Babesia caballi]
MVAVKAVPRGPPCHQDAAHAAAQLPCVARELLLKVLFDLVNELLRVEEFGGGWAVDGNGEVLGVEPVVNCIDGGALELAAELHQSVVAIHHTALLKRTGPCDDGRNGVGRGGASLLVHTEVASDGAMSSLS